MPARKAARPKGNQDTAASKTTVLTPAVTLRTKRPKPVTQGKKPRSSAIVRERNQSEQEFRPWPTHSMPARLAIETAYAITDAHGRYGQPGFSLGEVTARVETFSRIAEQVLHAADRRTWEQSIRNALKQIHDPPKHSDQRWERELLDLVKKGLI